jgi:hypothetical protein
MGNFEKKGSIPVQKHGMQLDQSSQKLLVEVS